MSTVNVTFGDNASDTATLLLAAAEELGYEPDVVRTSSDQHFKAPVEVVEKAGLQSQVERDETETVHSVNSPEDSDDESEEQPDAAPAKKAAKKSTSKRSAKKAASPSTSDKE